MQSMQSPRVSQSLASKQQQQQARSLAAVSSALRAGVGSVPVCYGDTDRLIKRVSPLFLFSKKVCIRRLDFVLLFSLQGRALRLLTRACCPAGRRGWGAGSLTSLLFPGHSCCGWGWAVHGTVRELEQFSSDFPVTLLMFFVVARRLFWYTCSHWD